MPTRRHFLTTTIVYAPPVPGPEQWQTISSVDLAPLPPEFDPDTGEAPTGSGPWLPVMGDDGVIIWTPTAGVPGGGGGGSGETGGVWIGEVREFSADTVPAGWLRANGQQVAQSSFPALYARYGNGTRYPTPPADPGLFRVVDKTPAEVAFEMGDSTSRFYVWPGTGDDVVLTFDSDVFRWDSTLHSFDEG